MFSSGGNGGFIIGKSDDSAGEQYAKIADKIRSMSDEDLATLCLDWYFVGYRESTPKDRIEVYHDILKWLQSKPLI